MALIGAAVLVPALVLKYVYSVDIYEDTPFTGIGATIVWGAVSGVLFGVATAAISGTGAGFGGDHRGVDPGSTFHPATGEDAH